MNEKQFGFKLIKFLRPPYFYKVLEIDSSVPMDSQEYCPCDDCALKTICVLVGNNGSQKLRIGCCDSCGYIGFIDRPSKEFIDTFYLEDWDDAHNKNIQLEIEKYKARGGSRFGASLASVLHADKNRYVLDIGCGYGRDLKSMEKEGFSKLIGVESSKHRAEIASHAHHFKTLVGSFENPSVQAELKKIMPFGLIFIRHVLEHTYHPSEIIQLCSQLQKTGDYLLIMIPNAQTEGSGSIILFLPHLHSLMPASLERLLAKHGYVVEHSFSHPGENHVIARKTNGTVSLPQKTNNYFEKTLNKFVSSLGLDRPYLDTPRILWWFRRIDFGGQARVLWRPLVWFQWVWMSKLYYRYKYKDLLIHTVGKVKYKKRPSHVAGMVGLLVSSLQKRYVPHEESPLEIQYEKDIKLQYK